MSRVKVPLFTKKAQKPTLFCAHWCTFFPRFLFVSWRHYFDGNLGGQFFSVNRGAVLLALQDTLYFVLLVFNLFDDFDILVEFWLSFG